MIFILVAVNFHSFRQFSILFSRRGNDFMNSIDILRILYGQGNNVFSFEHANNVGEKYFCQ